jgi:hypothetical protein
MIAAQWPSADKTRKITDTDPGIKRKVQRCHTKNNPLALASSHGRHITVIPERALESVGKWPFLFSIPLPNRFCNGRFYSVTAA